MQNHKVTESKSQQRWNHKITLSFQAPQLLLLILFKSCLQRACSVHRIGLGAGPSNTHRRISLDLRSLQPGMWNILNGGGRGIHIDSCNGR